MRCDRGTVLGFGESGLVDASPALEAAKHVGAKANLEEMLAEGQRRPMRVGMLRVEGGASRSGDKQHIVAEEPGERSRVLSLDPPTEPTSADVNAELSWTGDLFIRAESMADVAEQLSEVFDTPVEVDATLAQEMVSETRFEREAGLQAALRELAMSLGAQLVALEGGGFRIAP